MSVWQATDSITGQELGLRLFDIKHFSSSDTFQRFVDYLSRLQNLRHTNILPTLETGEHKSVYYLTMPYLPGGSICDLINRLGPMPDSFVQRTITGIANGLNYAHNEGFLHLNLHPNNVFFDGEFGPFISDFALPGFLGEHDLEHAGYQAPEIWQKGKVGAYTDVYGLGAMIFQLLVGHPVFLASNIDLLRTQQIDQVINFPAHVSRDMQHIIKKCLHQNINARYQSVTEVLTDLQSKGVYNLGITPKQESNFFKNNTEENFFYDLELLSDVGEGEIDFFSSGDTLKTDNEPFLDGQTVKVKGDTASLPGFLNTHSEGEQYQEGLRIETGGYSELEAFGPSNASEKKQKRLFYLLLFLVVLLSTTIAFLLGRRYNVMKVEKSDTPLAGIIKTQTLSPQETMVTGNARQTSVAVTATTTPSKMPTSTQTPTPEINIDFQFIHDADKLQVINDRNIENITEIFSINYSENDNILDLKWSPISNQFIVLTTKGVALYSGETFLMESSITLDHNCKRIFWKNEGRRVIIYPGRGDEKVFLLDIEPEMTLVTTFSESYEDLAFSMDGSSIAFFMDNTIKVLDTQTLEISTIYLDGDYYDFIALSSDGNEVATVPMNYPEVVIWSVKTGARLKTITHPPSDCSGETSVGKFDIAWVKDDTWLVVSDCYSEVHVLNAKTSQWFKDENSGGGRFSPYFSVSPNHNGIIGSYHGMYSNFCIWNTDNWKRTVAFDWYADGFTSFLWSPDSLNVIIYVYGNSLAGYGDLKNGLYLIDAKSGIHKQLTNFDSSQHYYLQGWSPDGKRIIAKVAQSNKVIILGIPE